jgi:hypothetical protein
MLVFYNRKQYATHLIAGFAVVVLMQQAIEQDRWIMLVSGLLMGVVFAMTRPQRRD